MDMQGARKMRREELEAEINRTVTIANSISHNDIRRILAKCEQKLESLARRDLKIPRKFKVRLEYCIEYFDNEAWHVFTRHKPTLLEAASQFQAKLRTEGWPDATVTLGWFLSSPFVPKFKVVLVP
jgi:hypothetical protein